MPMECTVSVWHAGAMQGKVVKGAEDWDSTKVLPPGGVSVPCNDASVTVIFSRCQTMTGKEDNRKKRQAHVSVVGLHWPAGRFALLIRERPGRDPLVQLHEESEMDGKLMLYECDRLRSVLLQERQQQLQLSPPGQVRIALQALHDF